MQAKTNSQADQPKADVAASLWRNGDFLRLWLATTVSSLGDFFTAYALPLLIFSVTGSALQTGVSYALNILPYALISPFAGVMVDRLDRKQIMVVTRLVQGALISTIPLAQFGGWLTIWQVYVVGFVMGCFGVIFGAASLAALPNLVSKEQLVAANARQHLTLSLAQLGGPVLAGLLVAATEPATALVVDTLSFFLAAGLLLTISRPFQASSTGRKVQTVVADIREGFAYLWQNRLIRSTTLLIFASNILLSGTISQMVVFAKVELRLDDFAVALIFAGEGAGAVLAAPLAERVGKRWPLGWIVLAAQPVFAVSVLLFALATNVWMAALAMLLIGVAGSILLINVITLRQRVVPDYLQGRVSASARAVQTTGAPLGAFLVSLLVGPLAINLREIYLVLAGLALLVAVAAFATPLRQRDLDQGKAV